MLHTAWVGGTYRRDCPQWVIRPARPRPLSRLGQGPTSERLAQALAGDPALSACTWYGECTVRRMVAVRRDQDCFVCEYGLCQRFPCLCLSFFFPLIFCPTRATPLHLSLEWPRRGAAMPIPSSGRAFHAFPAMRFPGLPASETRLTVVPFVPSRPPQVSVVDRCSNEKRHWCETLQCCCRTLSAAGPCSCQMPWPLARMRQAQY